MQDPSGGLTITGVVQREAWLQRAMPRQTPIVIAPAERTVEFDSSIWRPIS